MKKFLLCLLSTCTLNCMEIVEVVVPIESTQSPNPVELIDEIVRAAVFVTFDSDPRTVFVAPVIRQALESEISNGSDSSDSSTEAREYRQRIIKKFSGVPMNSLEGTDYIELRQWVLQELKEYNEQNQRQLKQLKEQTAKDTEELEVEKRKTRNAIIVTVVTTVCGLITTVTTYLLTHYLGENSDGL